MLGLERLFLRRGRLMVLGVPWFWLLLFFAVPFFILLRISVTDMGEQLNPFAPLIEVKAGHFSLHLKFSHYVSLILDPESGWGQTLYIEAYFLSVRYALLVFILWLPLCLFLGAQSQQCSPTATPDGHAALLDLVFIARLCLERLAG